ncbi:MAG: alpha/beta fold hydrolase [Acetobacteraceae bacterium]
METVTAEDGVKLAYTEAGRGEPIVFVHEFAGDMRSWETQLRFFSRRYHAIAFNARGYPPSDVAAEPGAYSQERAVDDVRCVLRGLGIARAHVVGLSMGAFATLHFGLRYPDMAISLVAAGVGYGASAEGDPGGVRARFQAEIEETARAIRAEGMTRRAATYARGPARLQLLAKDPRGHAEFAALLAEHSTEGSALTMLGVQRARPNLYDLAEKFRLMQVPTLIVCGDEDEPTLEPGIFLKRSIPMAGLVTLPRTGHAINLEEPALFNAMVLDFLTCVASGGWTARDPATRRASVLERVPVG